MMRCDDAIMIDANARQCGGNARPGPRASTRTAGKPDCQDARAARAQDSGPGRMMMTTMIDDDDDDDDDDDTMTRCDDI